MATKITDVIIPEIFELYMNKEPLALNAFYQSGIMVNTPEFNRIAAEGGYTATLPQWDELDGDYVQRTDSDSGLPTFNRISTTSEVCVKCFDIYRVGAAALASELAGDNAMMAIQAKIAHKIANLDQKRILQTLQGVFASTNMAANVLDKSTDVLTPEMIIEAQGLLGDRQDQVTAIAMHSATYTLLKKLNLISVLQPSSITGLPIETYGNKRIIVDDELTDNAGVYTTYLFTNGAIAYGRGGEEYAVEIGKIPHMEEEGITVRKNHIFHVRGTKWIGSTSSMITPAIDLILGSNWDTAYPNKQISVVALKHRVAAAGAAAAVAASPAVAAAKKAKAAE